MADHGTLTVQDRNKSMMALYRIVAAAYFKKYRSAFEHQSQESLFKTFADVGTSHTQHVHFLKSIRDTIWARVPFEDELAPSSGALKLHWLRSVWVIRMWSQADLKRGEIGDVACSRWKVEIGQFKVVWEIPDHIASIAERVALLGHR